MTTLAEKQAETGEAESMADVLHRLGDVPPERVRMRPAPGTATEADVVNIEAHEDRLFELVDGTLVEKTVGMRESILACALASILETWVREHKLGVVSITDGFVRLIPGRVRAPDVAYYSVARLPGGRVPDDAVPQMVPDLAVEVLSKGNTRREMKMKREECFKAGTRLVWEIDASSRSAAVYASPEEFRVLQEHEALDGGEVLPGLKIPLAGLFAKMDGPIG